ncbi:MAG: DUF664 domain-containing protein [Bacteroidota bacterium]
MKAIQNPFSRRNFLKKSSLLTLGTGSILSLPQSACAQMPSVENDINLIGPKSGYSPQIGTLVSMLNWMRNTIMWSLRGLSVDDLDYLHDEQSNTIGAMLLHLAATERFYQINTFDGRRWGDWEKEDRDTYQVAMNLGDAARKQIKGNPLDFYLEKLISVREHTLIELANRDDAWLMEADENFWSNGPTNNYCKWFHVCEHESNHNGQIKWIASRLPK